MLGIITVLSLGMTEKLSMLYLIKNKHTQELKIMFNYFFIAIIFAIISYFKYEKYDFSFLNDYKFYISVILENVGFYFAIKNYNKQQNFSQIAFAAFSSIYLIIGISYLYQHIFNINMVLHSPYHNIYEVIAFSIIFMILTLLYFSDKIKNNEIKHPIDLFLYAIFLVNTYCRSGIIFDFCSFKSTSSFCLSLKIPHKISHSFTSQIPINWILRFLQEYA